MTFAKAGTEDLPMKKVELKQLSRGRSLIGNGQLESSWIEWTHSHPRPGIAAGANPTTLLLDVRVINIGLAINWSNMMYWRHVVLTGLSNSRTLRLSAISHLQCGPTMQDITQRVNGCRKLSSLAGRYAEKSLR